MWTASRRLKDLAYADDVSLLGDDLEDLLGLVEATGLEASKFGHPVNIRKTERTHPIGLKVCLLEVWV